MTTKREAILQSALDLITSNGIQHTAVSMIADIAQVGIGTVYRYFKNRDDLVTALYFEIVLKYSRAIAEGYTDELTIWNRYRIIWLNSANFLINHPKEANFLQQYNYSPYMTDEIADKLAVQYAPLFQLYHSGVEQGIFKEMPLVIVNSIWNGIITELSRSSTMSSVGVISNEDIELALKASWDAFRK